MELLLLSRPVHKISFGYETIGCLWSNDLHPLSTEPSGSSNYDAEENTLSCEVSHLSLILWVFKYAVHAVHAVLTWPRLKSLGQKTSC